MVDDSDDDDHNDARERFHATRWNKRWGRRRRRRRKKKMRKTEEEDIWPMFAKVLRTLFELNGEEDFSRVERKREKEHLAFMRILRFKKITNY